MKTPYYFYDFDEISRRYERLKSAFAPSANNIFYAIKANSNIAILKHLCELGSGFDCVSANEIRRALLAGAPGYKIIYSGVGKSADEIAFALENKILYINAESQAELLLIENIAQKMGKVANISLRINPNIDAKTHPYISTGLAQNKFGVDLPTAKELYLYAHKSSHLQPIAVHFHIGSQLLDLLPVVQAAYKVREFVDFLLAAGLNIRFFDIGGGIGVAYEDGHSEPDLAQFAAQIRQIAGHLCICTEPGRFLLAPAAQLVTSVLYEKQNEQKRFVIVDASMAEFMRATLYGAKHKISYQTARASDFSLADIVGGVCESADFLAKDVLLPKLLPNDKIILENAGAYGFCMSSNYNSRTQIAEFAQKAGKIFCIRRAQTFEEMIMCEQFDE